MGGVQEVYRGRERRGRERRGRKGEIEFRRFLLFFAAKINVIS